MARKNVLDLTDDNVGLSIGEALGTTSATAPNPVGELQAQAAAAIENDRPLADRPLAVRGRADRPHAGRVDSAEVSQLPSRNSAPMTSPLKAMRAAVDSGDRLEELERKDVREDVDPAFGHSSFTPAFAASSRQR